MCILLVLARVLNRFIILPLSSHHSVIFSLTLRLSAKGGEAAEELRTPGVDKIVIAQITRDQNNFSTATAQLR